MLGSVVDSEYGQLIRSTDVLGDFETTRPAADRVGLGPQALEFQPVETVEVAVERCESSAVFDGERSQVRIVGQISCGTCDRQQISDDIGVACCWMKDACAWLVQPEVH